MLEADEEKEVRAMGWDPIRRALRTGEREPGARRLCVPTIGPRLHSVKRGCRRPRPPFALDRGAGRPDLTRVLHPTRPGPSAGAPGSLGPYGGLAGLDHPRTAADRGERGNRDEPRQGH